MVKHIVFFKLKPEIKDKQQAAQQVINTLLPLKKLISQIKNYELGINFAERDTAFDIALISEFENRQDLETYRSHPLHLQAVEQIKPLIAQTASVDYEI